MAVDEELLEVQGDAVKITVVGTPAPQGSKRHVGHGVMVESSKLVKPWRQDVVAACLEQVPDQCALDGPLHLSVEFVLYRPVSASRKRLAKGAIGPPDLSKLVRSTEDALKTAGAIVDDSRFVSVTATKRFASDGEPTGAHIEITRA